MSSVDLSSVQLPAGTDEPPHVHLHAARLHEPWYQHRLQWALSLPRGVHVTIGSMTAWACLGVGCGATALAAEPHGPALTCALALIVGAIYSWAVLFGATWVEDELAMRATAPLFLLLTIVAVLMTIALTGTPRVWLAVLAGLQCVCLIAAFSPYASSRHKRDFGWRGLRRVGASRQSKYGDWWLSLRSRMQAFSCPRVARPASHLHASTPMHRVCPQLDFLGFLLMAACFGALSSAIESLPELWLTLEIGFLVLSAACQAGVAPVCPQFARTGAHRMQMHARAAFPAPGRAGHTRGVAHTHMHTRTRTHMHMVRPGARGVAAAPRIRPGLRRQRDALIDCGRGGAAEGARRQQSPSSL